MLEDAHFHPSKILTAFEGLEDAVDCYKHFDKREAGWLKIELVPGDEEVGVCAEKPKLKKR